MPFTALPPDVAGPTIRRAFPHFYLFVMASAALAAATLARHDGTGAAWLALITVTTLPTRQILMPAINRTTDQGRKARSRILHGLSVVVTPAHILMAGHVLARFLNG